MPFEYRTKKWRIAGGQAPTRLSQGTSSYGTSMPSYIQFPSPLDKIDWNKWLQEKYRIKELQAQEYPTYGRIRGEYELARERLSQKGLMEREKEATRRQAMIEAGKAAERALRWGPQGIERRRIEALYGTDWSEGLEQKKLELSEMEKKAIADYYKAMAGQQGQGKGKYSIVNVPSEDIPGMTIPYVFEHETGIARPLLEYVPKKTPTTTGIEQPVTEQAPTTRQLSDEEVLKRYPDAKKAPDGNWYVKREGKWYRID